jgi:hypothetical protein
MKQSKKKFKSPSEMKSFLAGIKKRNEEAIKKLDHEIKKYEILLQKSESMIAEPKAHYKRK